MSVYCFSGYGRLCDDNEEEEDDDDEHEDNNDQDDEDNEDGFINEVYNFRLTATKAFSHSARRQA